MPKRKIKSVTEEITAKCSNCRNWRPVISEETGFGNCSKIKVGKDVRITAYYLQTGADFCCIYNAPLEAETIETENNGKDTDNGDID